MQPKHVESKGGVMFVGIPDYTLAIVQAISRKTGKDFVQVIAQSLLLAASKVLDSKEQEELAKQLSSLNE